MVFIIKADGSQEEFNQRKIIRTCLRAGANRKLASEIAQKIGSQVREGWTTHKIYEMILNGLDKEKDPSSLLFTLRESIAKIDPESFEIYAKKLLEAHGYFCEWNRLIKGRCVEHQIDVIARKEKLYLVECKHHVNPHRFCGLGIVLQVQARMEDVNDGFAEGRNRYMFDNAWVFTNTKFSFHAKKYAAAKNIILTGWSYKGNYSLENMAEAKQLYPITILRANARTQKTLLENNIITLDDFLSDKKIKNRLKRSEYANIFSQIESLLNK